MTFKLVATDLDGTLLHAEYEVSEFTVDVLRRAQEAGVRIVPVTARSPRSTKPIAEQFSIRGYAVCGSGSLVYDLDNDVVVEERVLQSDVAAKLVRALRETWPGVLFAAERVLEFSREPGYEFAPPSVEIHEADALDFIEQRVTKLIALHPRQGRDVLMRAARDIVGEAAHIGHAGPGGWIEILDAGATKAATLARLCEQLGVRSDEVIAFGDWPIDIPMLEWAGRGVAPSNAHPDVLAAADEIAKSNDEDGIALVLERLLNDGELRGM